MKEYFIEFNGKFIKSYKSEKKALAFAKTKAKQGCVNVWEGPGVILWSNYE